MLIVMKLSETRRLCAIEKADVNHVLAVLKEPTTDIDSFARTQKGENRRGDKYSNKLHFGHYEIISLSYRPFMPSSWNLVLKDGMARDAGTLLYFVQ